METEGFSLEYVDGRGELYSGLFEAMWSTRFEAARQVRTFPSYRGQRNFPGWSWAATSGELVGFELWVELGHLMRLDSEPDVGAVASQPCRIHPATSQREFPPHHRQPWFIHQLRMIADTIEAAAAPRNRGDGSLGLGLA
ncbi:hypothetical protein ACFYO0_25715 [Streptomyces sp. NPDC006365]|uniref:hypothetical protein n=1 Tax=Streptomyces sp. NPDC006365 TaxID=3364744 RepID=UPI0036769122